MKTKQGLKIEKELKMVGECYCNNFGVEAYKLEDGRIFLQATKLGRKIPNHWSIVSRDYFLERFRNEEKSNYETCLDALKFLEEIGNLRKNGMIPNKPT